MALIVIVVWSVLILAISIVAMATQESDPTLMGEGSYEASGEISKPSYPQGEARDLSAGHSGKSDAVPIIGKSARAS